MDFLTEAEKRYLGAVGYLSGLCIVLYAIRAFISQSFELDFVFENLALAWLGLICGWALVKNLQNHRWRNWQNIILTILWLMFLPNTWYVLTDFLHVLPTGEVSELYDIVFVSTLVINGFVLGFTSLFLVHHELYKRTTVLNSALLIAAVLLLSSFAIYLGRDLRWNSWDVIANPGGLVLNVSDRVVDPFGHRQAINVTGLFFVLLSSVYFGLWSCLKPYSGKSPS